MPCLTLPPYVECIAIDGDGKQGVVTTCVGKFCMRQQLANTPSKRMGKPIFRVKNQQNPTLIGGMSNRDKRVALSGKGFVTLDLLPCRNQVFTFALVALGHVKQCLFVAGHGSFSLNDFVNDDVNRIFGQQLKYILSACVCVTKVNLKAAACVMWRGLFRRLNVENDVKAYIVDADLLAALLHVDLLLW